MQALLRPIGAVLAARAAVVASIFAAAAATGCTRSAVPIELFADGFDPRLVSFIVEDRGTLSDEAVAALATRPEIDGALRIPADGCGGPCRVALVSVYVNNETASPVAPPVVRLAAPAGRPERMPIAFRGAEISPGRNGRIRWLVALWPEEKALSATVSSSVFVDVKGGSAPAASAAPAASPPPAVAAPLSPPPVAPTRNEQSP